LIGVGLFVVACTAKSKDESERTGSNRQRLDVVAPFAFPIEQSLFRTVVQADNGVEIGPGGTIRARTGQIGNAAGTLSTGPDARIGDRAEADVVSIYSGGDTRLGARTYVTGFLQSNGSVDQGPDVVVALGVRSNVPPSTPRSFKIEATFPAPSGGLHLRPNQAATLSPGAYEALELGPKSSVRLTSGRYHFGTVQIGPNATLDIDDTQGEVLVFVAGSVRFSGLTTFRKGPEGLAVVVTGAGPVELYEPFGGTIVAPSGEIRLVAGGAPTFEGAFIGERVDIDPHVTVKLRPFEGWAALLCDKATGPTLAQARTLPTVCSKPGECCDPELKRVTLTGGQDRYDVPGPNTCVFAGDGDDIVTGCKMSGSFVLGGAGDDELMLGQGVVAYGGPGNDRIESFGNATLFGNEGDDVLIAHAGTNVIFPGPGKDQIETGSGDDTVILLDACEATAGKVIDLGAGTDTVVSPLTRAELESRGVKLIGVETVRVEGDSCKSECRNPPKCLAAGRCVVNSDQSLGCSCPPWASGPLCETPHAIGYAPTPAPPLNGADDATRLQQTRTFLTWVLNGTVGEATAARAALDATRGNRAISEAFVTSARDLLQSPSVSEQMTAISVLGYLNCRRCVDALIEAFPTTVPTDSEARLNARAVQSRLAFELAHSKTIRTKGFLLEHLARHTDLAVRQRIIFSLSQAYGDSIRASVATIARSDEMEAFDWIANGDPDFNAKLRQHYQLQ
jgi:hypothetical protein